MYDIEERRGEEERFYKPRNQRRSRGFELLFKD